MTKHYLLRVTTSCRVEMLMALGAQRPRVRLIARSAYQTDTPNAFTNTPSPALLTWQTSPALPARHHARQPLHDHLAPTRAQPTARTSPAVFSCTLPPAVVAHDRVPPPPRTPTTPRAQRVAVEPELTARGGPDGRVARGRVARGRGVDLRPRSPSAPQPSSQLGQPVPARRIVPRPHFRETWDGGMRPRRCGRSMP